MAERFQTSQNRDELRRAIVTSVAKAPSTTDKNLFGQGSLTSVVCKMLDVIFKEE